MPFKDHEKYKEWNRNRMKKTREEKKKKMTDNVTWISEPPEDVKDVMKIMIKTSSGKYGIEFTIASDHILTTEERDAYEKLFNGFKKRIDGFFIEDKKKTSFSGCLRFIPNLLSLHVDLKMLKQCGGY